MSASRRSDLDLSIWALGSIPTDRMAASIADSFFSLLDFGNVSPTFPADISAAALSLAAFFAFSAATRAAS
ncbi:MAG TPA: hypothetical protein PKA47_19590, partial [Accumulibacter sp.]|nr:hypothetical protein [Accumulibacter sp.]